MPIEIAPQIDATATSLRSLEFQTSRADTSTAGLLTLSNATNRVATNFGKLHAAALTDSRLAGLASTARLAQHQQAFAELVAPLRKGVTGSQLDQLGNLVNAGTDQLNAFQQDAAPAEDARGGAALIQGGGGVEPPSFPRIGEIDAIGRDLTAEAAEGGMAPVIGRSDEIREMAGILGRQAPQKNNVLIYGAAGTGKTALAEGLAQGIVNGQFPELAGRRVVALDLTGLASRGSQYVGMMQKSFDALTKTVDGQKPILFIDEIHRIDGMGAGENGKDDVAQMMKERLGRGEMQTIGATTKDEAEKSILKDAAMARRFKHIDLQEMDPNQTLDVLRGRQAFTQAQNGGVEVTDAALRAAAKAGGMLPGHSPDREIDLVNNLAANANDAYRTGPSELFRARDQAGSLSRQLDALKGSTLISEHNQRASVARRLAKANAKVGAMQEQWQGERDTVDAVRAQRTSLSQALSAFDELPGDDPQAVAGAKAAVAQARAGLKEAERAQRSIAGRGGPMLRSHLDAKAVFAEVAAKTGKPVADVKAYPGRETTPSRKAGVSGPVGFAPEGQIAKWQAEDEAKKQQ